MKKITIFLFILVLSSCAGTGKISDINRPLSDGVYEAAARGYHGLIHIQVVIEDGLISQIDLLASKEDRYVGEAAIEELIEQVLIFGSADIDVITGATETSNGFLAALADVIRQAGQ